jgi:hypothetical protein
LEAVVDPCPVITSFLLSSLFVLVGLLFTGREQEEYSYPERSQQEEYGIFCHPSLKRATWAMIAHG